MLSGKGKATLTAKRWDDTMPRVEEGRCMILEAEWLWLLWNCMRERPLHLHGHLVSHTYIVVLRRILAGCPGTHQGHMAESAELARRAVFVSTLHKASRKASLHDGGIGRAGLALACELARLLDSSFSFFILSSLVRRPVLPHLIHPVPVRDFLLLKVLDRMQGRGVRGVEITLLSPVDAPRLPLAPFPG